MLTQTDRDTLLADMFAALDRGDVPEYLTYLAPDAALRFANAEPVVGAVAIKESLEAFYTTFSWVHHDHVATWNGRDGAAVEADVSRVSDLQRLIDTAVEKFGGLDSLVYTNIPRP